MRRATRRPAQGYVLVTVMVAMVLLALVAARLDERVANFRDGSAHWGRWVQAQADLAPAATSCST